MAVPKTRDNSKWAKNIFFFFIIFMFTNIGGGKERKKTRKVSEHLNRRHRNLLVTSKAGYLNQPY